MVKIKICTSLKTIQASMAVDQYNCHYIVLANGLEQKLQVFLKIQKCKELTNLPKSPFYTGSHFAHLTIEFLLIICQSNSPIRSQYASCQAIGWVYINCIGFPIWVLEFSQPISQPLTPSMKLLFRFLSIGPNMLAINPLGASTDYEIMLKYTMMVITRFKKLCKGPVVIIGEQALI